ncbi:uncharacterized protein EKO05_0007637 [Ascochyta rabiei]|uniref:uncharacterized protein n=1 Tax=Didymella rabiei TaxID=5454 RepID=UPI00220DB371|nr:uncharacterized protein EKO05_0007637 [Ascochyta rabiei]UPX17271.1 hypothetical protein EKO05_0007637 [Ascochyta rabiei]
MSSHEYPSSNMRAPLAQDVTANLLPLVPRPEDRGRRRSRSNALSYVPREIPPRSHFHHTEFTANPHAPAQFSRRREPQSDEEERESARESKRYAGSRGFSSSSIPTPLPTTSRAEPASSSSSPRGSASRMPDLEGLRKLLQMTKIRKAPGPSPEEVVSTPTNAHSQSSDIPQTRPRTNSEPGPRASAGRRMVAKHVVP